MKTPSRLIIVVCLLFAVAFAYTSWKMGLENTPVYIIPLIVLMATAFVMAPQIDWWWYRRNPRDIDPMLGNLFQKHLTFYQNLNEADKLRFRQRVDLYLMTVEFIVPSQNEEKVIPEDLKHWVSAYRTMTTWGKEKIENEKFEKIVAYMNPFPSPQHPHDFHACESFEEDGVLLFALAPMIHSITAPSQCFNPVLYEFCKVFQTTYWSKHPELNESHWADLEQISGFSKEQIHKTIGLPDMDIRGVAMSFYILFPQRFKRFLPNQAEGLKETFGF